jgi:hypothetical protein
VRDWLVPRLQQADLTVCIDYASFTPGAPSITEIERAVLQSRKTVCILTPEYLQSGWTEFENLLVQTLDPAARQQRLIPLLLSPYAMPPRLGMLTHIDCTRAEEQYGNVERLITEIRRRSRARRSRLGVTTAHVPFAVPTGALSLDSPLYIERRHDHIVRQQVTRTGSTTLIEGARQMGKTSLMVRALAHARAQQCAVIDFNFQTLDEQHFDTLETPSCAPGMTGAPPMRSGAGSTCCWAIRLIHARPFKIWINRRLMWGPRSSLAIFRVLRRGN